MLAIPILFISGLIFAEISMIFAAIVPGIDSFNYFYTLFMTPMFLFFRDIFPLKYPASCHFKDSLLHPSLSPCQCLQVALVRDITGC